MSLAFSSNSSSPTTQSRRWRFVNGGGKFWCVVAVFAILLIIWYAVFAINVNDHRDYDRHGNIRREANLGKRRERMVAMAQPFRSGELFTGGTTSGPKVVDCSVVTRYCTNDNDCVSMCKSYASQRVLCDSTAHVCTVTAASSMPSPPSIGDDHPDNEKRYDEICNAKLGEYAMLVDYTNLGAATWRCVPLYNHFNNSDRFCEGGVFHMNAMLREPSYRDCSCPPGTTRMIKRVLDQYDIGLPHCIASENKRFYQDDLTVVDSDEDDKTTEQ